MSWLTIDSKCRERIYFMSENTPVSILRYILSCKFALGLKTVNFTSCSHAVYFSQAWNEVIPSGSVNPNQWQLAVVKFIFAPGKLSQHCMNFNSRTGCKFWIKVKRSSVLALMPYNMSMVFVGSTMSYSCAGIAVIMLEKHNNRKVSFDRETNK